MSNKKFVSNSIEINADAESVWDALVNPDKTQIYMFGCRTVSDWQVGSKLDWTMIHEGNEITPVSGYILELEKNRRLKYSVIEPNASYPIILENHLDVLYTLEESNGITTLSVYQDGFERAANGEQRYLDVYNNGDGWNPILIQIKNMLEN
jgi:uncharacterized protein YndB with AHSA1/START domain